MLKQIAIVGAGGLGREVLVLLHQINEVKPTWHILGFYDDNEKLKGQVINNFPCLGTIDDLACIAAEIYVTVAIGYSSVKSKIADRLQNPLIKFATLLHPAAAPKKYQHILFGEGTIVFQGAVLTTNITIGKNVLIYLNCTVGHDVVIGECASLMTGTNIGGNTILEEEVFIGSNAAILQGITIGKGTTVGAGAVVTKDLPANCTAVGVPAKILKHD